jgi:hypothetical protein
MASHGFLLPTRNSVMTSDDAATLTAKTNSDGVGLAERAESAGFDSVWVGDSVLAKPRHEPLTTLAALATATESVSLGTAAYLPPLRHPVHVARASTRELRRRSPDEEPRRRSPAARRRKRIEAERPRGAQPHLVTR